MNAIATPPPTPPVARGSRAAVLLVFALSGVAGLVHEVAWARLLRLVMGNTTYAVATVLTVFMAGLALGSYVGGRAADRRRDPLRVFGLLECAVGLYCLFLPQMIDAIEPIYRAAYRAQLSPLGMSMMRFALCGAVLLVPSAMMGATLPVLARWFARSVDRAGDAVGRLYAINTLGAAVGAAAGAFALLPTLGLRKTILIGAAINATVGLIGLWLHRRSGEVTAAPAPPPAPDAPDADDAPTTYGPGAIRALLIGYGLSGLAAMTYQVAWTRVLALLIGSSVYAFGLILTAFIVGIGIGALVYARFADRVRDPLGRLATLQFVIGLSALVVVPVFGSLPFYLTGLIARMGESFDRLMAAEFALVLAVMLVPTLVMGAMFPLVARTFAMRCGRVGRSVGTVYGCNTVGGIVGAFLAGFVLIPVLGIQRTLFAAVAISVLVGAVFLLHSAGLTRRGRLVRAAVALAVALGAMLLVPRWDPAQMSFGPFVRAVWMSRPDTQSRQRLRADAERYETIFYDEGVSATVAVRRDADGALQLLTNGRVEATSAGGEPQQRLLAHIPMLLHPQPRDALVIGLASGITLDAAAQHPVRRLDCVELSPGVVDATRYFDEANHHVLDDKRVRLILADGRNHLALTDRKYDVIISQPSDPATAGVASLFTEEFFNACYDRLNDRGIACVWLKASTVDPRVFKSIVRTFARSFDDMSIWTATSFSEYMLVGSRGRMEIDFRVLADRINAPHVQRDFDRLRIRDITSFMTYMVTNRRGAIDFSLGAPVHRDDRPTLEFTAPRTVFTRRNPEALVASLLEHRDGRLDVLATLDDPESWGILRNIQLTTAARFDANAASFQAAARYASGDRRRALELLMKAGRLNPNDPTLVGVLDQHRDAMTRAVELGRYDDAIERGWQIVRLVPESVADLLNLAALLRDHGQPDHAAAVYEQVAAVQPDSYIAQHNLAKLKERLGRPTQAAAHYRRAIEIKPDLHQALNNLAWLIVTNPKLHLGSADEAVALATRANQLVGYASADYTDTLSFALEAAGRFADALEMARLTLSRSIDAGRADLARQARRRAAELERIVAEVDAGGAELSRLRSDMDLLVRARRYREAAALGYKVVELSPDSETDRMNLAALLRDSGQPRAAIEQYTLVTERFPNNYLAHHNLAKLLNRAGRFGPAATHYRLALGIKPDLTQALNNLAWLIATKPEAQLGTIDEAVGLAERACAQTQMNDPDLLDTLAEAYERQGRIDKALETASRALRVSNGLRRIDLVEPLTKRINRLMKARGSTEPVRGDDDADG